MATIYRAMIEASHRLPLVTPTARGLGIRRGVDIETDDEGLVDPGTGGMSVAVDEIRFLPDHRRPAEHGGTGRDPVWAMNVSDLPETLTVRLDPELEGHAFVEPAWPMSIVHYEDALAETHESWRKCD